MFGPFFYIYIYILALIILHYLWFACLHWLLEFESISGFLSLVQIPLLMINLIFCYYQKFNKLKLIYLVCVKGSDKPLDLALLIDSSESVARLFDDQIHFAVDRIVQNINIHPDAVRYSFYFILSVVFLSKLYQFWFLSFIISLLMNKF